jgi:hypothetical protein
LNGRMEPPVGREVLAGEMVREGDYWTVVFGGRQLRVRDSKGMGHLAELLSHPGTEISAVQLAAACSPRSATARRAREDAAGLGVEGDLGPVLDASAKAQYRQRLAELRAEADEAEAFHDPERAARARAEYQLLAAELAAAVGLGGRDRRAGSPQERARLNVTRAIKASVRRLGRHDPALAAHLDVSVLTGRACVYRPEHAVPVRWRVLTRPPRQAAQARRFEPPQTHYAQAGDVSIANSTSRLHAESPEPGAAQLGAGPGASAAERPGSRRPPAAAAMARRRRLAGLGLPGGITAGSANRRRCGTWSACGGGRMMLLAARLSRVGGFLAVAVGVNLDEGPWAGGHADAHVLVRRHRGCRGDVPAARGRACGGAGRSSPAGLGGPGCTWRITAGC